MNDSARTLQHSSMGATADIVPIPVSLFQKMSEAAKAFETFRDEMEDYLLSQDAAFLEQMRQARTHHLEGQTRSLDTLKRELCIE